MSALCSRHHKPNLLSHPDSDVFLQILFSIYLQCGSFLSSVQINKIYLTAFGTNVYSCYPTTLKHAAMALSNGPEVEPFLLYPCKRRKHQDTQYVEYLGSHKSICFLF